MESHQIAPEKRRSGCRLWLTLGLAALICFAFWAYYDLKDSYSVHTATSANRSEVFLSLPKSVSEISYWRDGVNYWAEFNIPEADFRILFEQFEFTEIREPQTINLKVYGDPNVFPPHGSRASVVVLDGLRYEESWDNGGGYDIVFDRLKSRAYYDFRKR
jgi:hypothetical protein